MPTIIPIPAFTDNYIWLLREGAHAAVVDPGDAAPVLAYLDREHLTLYARVLERAWVFRSLAADLDDRLLDLELHVGSFVATSFLAGVAFLTGATLHAIGRPASDALAAEVVLIRDRLRQIDRRQVGRNVDRGRQNLEPLRRGRSDFLEHRHAHDLWRGRLLLLGLRRLGLLNFLLLGGRRRFFDRHKVHLRLPLFLHFGPRAGGGENGQEDDERMQYYAKDGPAC